jgi:hypothetical protein
MEGDYWNPLNTKTITGVVNSITRWSKSNRIIYNTGSTNHPARSRCRSPTHRRLPRHTTLDNREAMSWVAELGAELGDVMERFVRDGFALCGEFIVFCSGWRIGPRVLGKDQPRDKGKLTHRCRIRWLEYHPDTLILVLSTSCGRRET